MHCRRDGITTVGAINGVIKLAAESFNLVDRELSEGPSPYLFGYPDVYGDDPKPHTSPYYWWFMYLKRHEGYKACCERGGEGEYSALYADWGDVRVDDFEEWFFEYGDGLFREPKIQDDLGEIKNPSQFATINLEDTMVVAVPFRIGERSLSKKEIVHQFTLLLDARFPDASAGRPTYKSDAKYRFAGYPQVAKLETRLLIYDAVTASPELPYWRIGEELALNGHFEKGKKYITNSKEQGEFGEEKRIQMTALVGKRFRQAEKQVISSVNDVFEIF